MSSPRVRVSCIAVKDNKIVLIKKLKKDYHNFNQLTLPGGGVDVFESLEDACIREMNEETGLQVEVPKLKGIVSFINHIEQYHWLTFIMITREVTGEIDVKERNKHIPEWIDIASIESNFEIPFYDKQLIIRAFEDNNYI